MIVNKDDAIKALEYVVAEKENTIYRPRPGAGESKYEHNDSASCLIGHCLEIMGVSVETLKELDIFGGAIYTRETQQILSSNDLSLSRGAIAVFSIAQTSQDAGTPWGIVLLKAKEVHKEYEGIE